MRGVNDTLSIGQHLSLIIFILVLLAFSAFFSGSETAFFSLSRFFVSGMEKERSRRKRLIPVLLAEPRDLLVTILFGNLLVNIAGTSVVTALVIGIYGEKGIGIAVGVMTVCILLVGEIVPKSLAINNARHVAAMNAPLLKLFMIVFTPVRIVLGAIADIAVDKSRILLGERRKDFGAFELAAAVETGYREGLFNEFENKVLTNLFLFSETTAREIQTPRVEVFSLGVETPLNEAVMRIRNRGFSRVPLYEGQDDHIVGVLLARDLLQYSRDERVELGEIMRAPRFVPGSKHIRELFGELITGREHVVMVVDEHGSFDGIVTLEDILEEIFGEIRDRREPRVDEYLLVDRDHVVVEGVLDIECFNELLHTELESRDVETIAGYLIERIGRVPREGEVHILDGLRFLVLSAESTRVNKIKIERVDPGSECDEFRS